MKKIIYIYLPDNFAEWEISNLLQIISMQKMLKNNKIDFNIKTISSDNTTIKSIGGLTIIPDCSLNEVNKEDMVAFLLCGAESWNNVKHLPALEKVKEYLKDEILVGAICGATLELAKLGIFNEYKHTSNSVEYLSMFSKNYHGQNLYKNKEAYIDKNLVTGSSTGGLLWAKYIIEYLEVFPTEFINSWYNYFHTHDPKYYLEMMQIIQ